MQRTTPPSDRRVEATDVALPPPSIAMSEDREWCVVQVNGHWEKIRIHDYEQIYRVHGLYDILYRDVLECRSPSRIRRMLERCMGRSPRAPVALRVLDLGAGNGMVGEEMAALGARKIVGVDIYPAAAEAARRERESVYDDYFVLDMTDLSDRDRSRLWALEFNCLTCVAALGFGDIPPAAFASAFNLVRQGGWVAFNIKSEFLEPDDSRGFAGLIRRMIDRRVVDLSACQEYAHRRATNGEPLHYTAFVCTKNRDIPAVGEL
jgi:predicted TPR repeat methyltransferase